MALYGKRKTYELPGASRAPLSATRRMLQARVTYEQHAKAHRAAEELGVSVSALLAELIDRMRVDEHGRPAWQSRYAPKPAQAAPSEPLRMSA